MVLKNTEATTIVEPTIGVEGRGASALRDPWVASLSSSPTRQQERRNQYRKRIDAAVLRLKQQHQRDRTTLARPTEELAQWLIAEDSEVPWLTCVSIAVAAKHFAGTYSPRRKVTGPKAKQRPPRPTPHELHTVWRHLFQDEPAEPSSMGSTATAPSDPDTSRSVHGRRKQLLEDEEWRIDIWRSYGSKEISPPSPFGCQQSPSWALGSTEPPSEERPVELWSPSSNDEPWGPDSPDESLEDDSHPDTVPGWPVFLDSLGEPLHWNNGDRQARVQQWRNEHTAGAKRTVPKRRHHLRTWRRSREVCCGDSCCACSPRRVVGEWQPVLGAISDGCSTAIAAVRHVFPCMNPSADAPLAKAADGLSPPSAKFSAST